jgi:hypothetical protein
MKNAVANHEILSTDWKSLTIAGCTSATIVLSKANKKSPIKNENIINTHYTINSGVKKGVKP